MLTENGFAGRHIGPGLPASRLLIAATLLFGVVGRSRTLAQTADFNFTPIGPAPSQDVIFTYEGTGCDVGCSLLWQYGDGSSENTVFPDVNPAFPKQYVAGTWTVVVTASPSGNTFTRDVGVSSDQGTITPNFDHSPMFPTVGQEVTFTDLSVGGAPGHWDWDFGDSSPHSFLQQPRHTYVSASSFDVTLVVSNQSGSSSLTAPISISEGVTPTPQPTSTPPPGTTATPTATPTPSVLQVLAGYIPVVGSTPGNQGSFFKTSIQLLNPGTEVTSGKLVFHPAGAQGKPTDPSLAWALLPGQTASYGDIVGSMGQSGLGSMDLYVGQGQAIPIVLTRIFDDGGTDGTSGFTEPFFRPADIPDGGNGFLIGPSDTARFRYNIGVRTLGNPVTLTATVRDSAGNVVHTETNSYGPNTFLQVSSTEFLGFSLGNDESIQIVFTGGGLIAYGATIDNVTNDSSTQFLPYITGVQTAQRTEPRGKRVPTPLLLATVVAMLGLGMGAVIAKR